MLKPIDLTAYLYPKYEKSQTCTISGLRPHKLPKNTSLDKLMTALEQAVRAAYEDGYRVFLTGSAQGVDIWAGELVIRLKKELPGIQLHLFVPYEGQANKWSEEWRKRYFTLHSQADEVWLMEFQYTPDCMHGRNRAMIDHSARLIAVYDGVANGGTKYTIGYARDWNVDVVLINPAELTV